MSTDIVLLHTFAYGEHLEGPQQRSLGFRLLAPVEPVPWRAEVEALARSLQGTPYPDQWPAADLFCSVLLANGDRIVAVARYGLVDHTPSQRRSGLELIGAVCPGNLSVPSALAVAQWLRQRRAEMKELRSPGDKPALADVLAGVAPQPAPNEPVPVLPIRMWQEGALLFAATSPSDPDRRLGLLEQGSATTWQWLPLVGPDFPVQTYAQRGPLVAWTPHLAGVALKLDRKSGAVPTRPTARRGVMAAVVAALILVLLGANLWATLALPYRLGVATPPAPHGPLEARGTKAASAPIAEDGRERLAQAIYRVLQKRGAVPAGSQTQLLHEYEGLLAENESLRVSSPDGKLALGAVGVLARRSPGEVEHLVREALADKGYDPLLVDRACQLVRERLAGQEKTPR